MIPKDIFIKKAIKIYKEAETPQGWLEFLKEKYKGGKKIVTNTNPKTSKKFPVVSMATLYKNDDNFKSKVQKEFQDWKKDKDSEGFFVPKKVDLESFKNIVSSVLGEHLTEIPNTSDAGTDWESSPLGSSDKKRTSEEKARAVKDNCGHSYEDVLSLTGMSALGFTPTAEDSLLSPDNFYFHFSSDSSSNHITQMGRSVYKDHIYNIKLDLDDGAPQGLGTKIFASQVYHAKRVGLKYIKCNAYRAPDGDPRWVGYKVWPKFGYDGKIPKDCLQNLSVLIKEQFDLLGYEKPYKISHLYSLPDNDGIKWWEEHGADFEAKFDLSDDSYSMKTFQAYLEKKAKSKTASRKYIRRDPFLRGLL